MERNKHARLIFISVLILAFFVCVIGYAAMGTKLKINGTTDMRTATWDLHFVDDWLVSSLGSPELCVNEECKIEEGADISSVAPIIGGTEILFPTLGLVYGDEVVYTFYVENSGTIDAVLDNCVKDQNISFIGSTTDVNKVMAGFNYYVLVNGVSLETILDSEDGETSPYRVVEGMDLENGEAQRMRIDVVFSYRGTEFHKENVKIDNLKLTLVFKQYIKE